MDMGGSNTRLWLMDEEQLLCEKKYPFGALCGKREGKAVLFARIRTALTVLLEENGLSEKDVSAIVALGMAGSEIGLCEIAHVLLPVDRYALAEKLIKKHLPEVTDIPFLFIPGIKTECGVCLADIIRGEESEVLGILPHLPSGKPVVLLLPGTHNKVIRISEKGEISDFRSTASGELLDLAVSKSVLAGSLSHDAPFSPYHAKCGMTYAEENGISAALFHARVMEKNGAPCEELTSFVYGAVLGDDVALLRRFAKGDVVYIGGNGRLAAAYEALLRGYTDTVLLEERITQRATLCGAQQLYRLHKASRVLEETLKSIERERVFAIIRGADEKTLTVAMEALYRGGIRLAEVTFDRSGRTSSEQTCQTIAALVKHFEGRMLIGAGTVCRAEEVEMAARAGARFIVSPTCDAEVITRTRSLSLVSIPAAYTATEIANALKFGAHYIKMFPADHLGEDYIRAVTAPLCDAKLLAVGGVTVENATRLMKGGFSGIGVGSALYDKGLIEKGDYDALTERAEAYVTAARAAMDG